MEEKSKSLYKIKTDGYVMNMQKDYKAVLLKTNDFRET